MHVDVAHPPLLFVHGMWEGAWVWQGYLDFFAARGYTCHALDLRGHDRSKPVPDREPSRRG